MEHQNPLHDIAQVVHISSNVTMGCPVCTKFTLRAENWQDSVNHFLKTHGWKLLHVGSEWSEDMKGESIHFTVAVVGQP